MVGDALSESSWLLCPNPLVLTVVWEPLHQPTANSSGRIESIRHITLAFLQMMSHLLHSNSWAGPGLPECPLTPIRHSISPRFSELAYSVWKSKMAIESPIGILEKPLATGRLLTLSLVSLFAKRSNAI